MKLNYTYPLTLLFIFIIGQTGLAQESPSPQASRFTIPANMDYLPGRVLFKLKPDWRDYTPTGIGSLQHRLDELDLIGLGKPFTLQKQANKHPNSPDLEAIYEAYFPKTVDIEYAINHLLASAVLEYAEPRYSYDQLYIPNDVYADTTLPIDFMWHLGQIQAYEAWDISKGDSNIVIGISDSGISFDHLDLRNNLAKNRQDPPDGIDNDADGYLDNYRGWDLSGANGSQSDNDPSVPCNVGGCVHGVPVAGIAAADADNRLGVTGVAFNCRYMPLKASSDSFPDGITHGYESILYGAQAGADIINCSWGGLVRSRVGTDVVQYVHENYQVGLIAACGNTPLDLAFYPASFPEVISVSNLHQGDSICCPTFLSSTYNYAVDVGAPGWELTSTVGIDRYGPFSGTSAASPVVAGAAGLVMAHFSDYTGFQAGQRLRVTTDDIYQNPYNQPFLEKLGTGRINLDKALNDPRKPSIRLADYRFSPEMEYNHFSRNDSLFIYPDFINHLDASSPNLEISLSIAGNTANFVEVVSGNWNAGVINMDETVSPSMPFVIRLRRNAPDNLVLNMRFQYQDTALDYDDFEYLTIIGSPTYVDVTENRLFTSINSLGNIGYAEEAEEAPGLGYLFNRNEQSAIGEAGFMVAMDTMLWDNVINENGVRAQGWQSTKRIQRESHPQADFYASGVMEDNTNTGLQVHQEVFAWSDNEASDYILVRYTMLNESGGDLTNAYAGIFADWEIFAPTLNAANYTASSSLVYTYDRTGSDPINYGISLVSGGGFRSFAGDKAAFDFGKQKKIDALQTIASSSTARVGTGANPVDVIQSIAAGPLTINNGDSTELVFALMAGETPTRLRNLAADAADRYRCYIGGFGPDKGFTSPTSPVLVGSPVTFSDLNPNASQWIWDFGDGNASNAASPSHTYQQPGDYIVRGTVTAGLCRVTQKRLVQVRRTVDITAEIREQYLDVFPNPAKEQLFINMRTQVTGSSNLKLVNSIGKVVWKKEFQVRSGSLLSETISLGKFTPGLYMIVYQEGDVLISKQVLIDP